MDSFMSKEILDMLSYRTALGLSLKQISLQETPLEQILDDIAKYRSSYLVPVSKARIPSPGSMRKLSEPEENSSSVSTTFWDSSYGSKSTQLCIQTISV